MILSQLMIQSAHGLSNDTLILYLGDHLEMTNDTITKNIILHGGGLGSTGSSNNLYITSNITQEGGANDLFVMGGNLHLLTPNQIDRRLDIEIFEGTIYTHGNNQEFANLILHQDVTIDLGSSSEILWNIGNIETNGHQITFTNWNGIGTSKTDNIEGGFGDDRIIFRNDLHPETAQDILFIDPAGNELGGGYQAASGEIMPYYPWPHPPDNIETKILTDSSIQVYWLDQNNYDHYKVNVIDEWGSAHNVSSNQQAIDLNLKACGSYEIYVQSIHDGDTGLPSIKQQVIMPCKPTAPILNAKYFDTTGIQLKWEIASNNSDGFIIERRVQGIDSWTTLLELKEKEYSDTNIEYCETYLYRVTAYNKDGLSPPSNTVQILTSELNIEIIGTPYFCLDDSTALYVRSNHTISRLWWNGIEDYDYHASTPGYHFVTANIDLCSVQDSILIEEINIQPPELLGKGCYNISDTIFTKNNQLANWYDDQMNLLDFNTAFIAYLEIEHLKRIGLETNKFGCRSDLQWFDLLLKPEVNIRSDAEAYCSNEQIALEIESSSKYSLADLEYQWNVLDTEVESEDRKVLFTYNKPGNPTIVLKTFNPLNGCSSLQTHNKIEVYQAPKAAFKTDKQTVTMIKPTIKLSNYSENAFSYQWILNNNSISLSNTNTFTFEQGGEHTLALIAENEVGCFDTAMQNISIESLLEPTASAINPMSDIEENKVFKPSINPDLINPSTYLFYIMNRWGNKIFKSTDPSACWKGTTNLNNKLVNSGNYIWHVLFEDIDGKKHRYSGGIFVVY